MLIPTISSFQNEPYSIRRLAMDLLFNLQERRALVRQHGFKAAPVIRMNIRIITTITEMRLQWQREAA